MHLNSLLQIAWIMQIIPNECRSWKDMKGSENHWSPLFSDVF